MNDYQFLPEAEEEMNEAAQFYEGRSEGLGEDFLDEVQHTVESILVPEEWSRRIQEPPSKDIAALSLWVVVRD